MKREFRVGEAYRDTGSYRNSEDQFLQFIDHSKINIFYNFPKSVLRRHLLPPQRVQFLFQLNHRVRKQFHQ